MKSTADKLFPDDYIELARLCNAISHPARIAILKFLLENNHQTCKSLVTRLPFSQSTVSQHLAELKQAGLISGTSFKTSMIYAIEPEMLNHLNKLLMDVFKLTADRKQLSLF
jgi:DNA-binding transcriptional ArsR family regulator